MRLTIETDLDQSLAHNRGFGTPLLLFNLPRHAVRFSTTSSDSIYRTWHVARRHESGHISPYEWLGSNPGGYPIRYMDIPRREITAVVEQYLNPIQAELWAYEFEAQASALIERLESWIDMNAECAEVQLRLSARMKCESFARDFHSQCASAQESLNELIDASGSPV